MAKFRYWNSALLEFIMFDNGFYSYTKSSGFDMAEPEAEFNWEKAEQSTGKEDVNGKEAFVGDEISFSIEEYYNGVTDYIGTIYYENGCMLIKTTSGDVFYFFEVFTNAEEFEIIGNIHENKEIEN